MVEIRCDSATLHVYAGFGPKPTDPQLGGRQVFDGINPVHFSSPGNQVMHVYTWLWKDGAPIYPTDPVWLRPGDFYSIGPILAVSDI
jgi:hypothetical protein